jgi:hypothetical protein
MIPAENSNPPLAWARFEAQAMAYGHDRLKARETAAAKPIEERI